MDFEGRQVSHGMRSMASTAPNGHGWDPEKPFDSKTSALHNRNDITTKQVRPLSLPDPRCHSPKVAPFHHAMKVGAAIGTMGSVARGVSAALAGGRWRRRPCLKQAPFSATWPAAWVAVRWVSRSTVTSWTLAPAPSR